MKVLLVEYDLYKSVGGGQTVYRRLIESNPAIEFYYLGRSEPAASVRPPNAKIIPYKEVYEVRKPTGEFCDLDIQLWSYSDFLEVSNIAASVAHVQFDIVDTPDYRVIGYLLGTALQRHGQKSCKVALALHGNLSETQRVNWGPREWIDVSADQREQWQYRVADIRYGLSRDYLEHWRTIAGHEGHYINPLRFVDHPAPVKWDRSADGVSLNFIGRTEGFKGPDLFVELLAWLPAGSYGAARIIGPSIVDRSGVSSKDHLLRMAARRGVPLEYHPCMSKVEMSQLFVTRGITVLPSRMDTFNLTALESVFSGCPIAVSAKAGVCRFLRETYPGVPFTTLDVDNLYAGAPALLGVINDYNRYRDRLGQALARANPVVDGLTLGRIYGSESENEEYLRNQAEKLYDRIMVFHRRQRTAGFERLAGVGVRLWDVMRNHIWNARPRQPIRDVELWGHYRQIFYLPEGTPEEIDAKFAYAADISGGIRIDRARVWSELARLERMRGNDFIAATYEIRVMRATDGDRLGLLPLVVATLKANGYPREAETVIALYGPKEQRFELAHRLLEIARTEHERVPERPFEFVEDNRTAKLPRVSVIVSLYRAANKLETFLRMLAQQPWIANGQAEVVFVDSHSPTDEYRIYQELAVSLGIKAIYARTAERETIQKAWNRGILLARAPYLAFLGVDEMVRPDCFALLAGELDNDPTLDWVQGNSVITEVDPHGTLQRDVMIYQRIPYDQDLVYLETCYLSWVGSLYRKSIHDRCGYYDESFGAAGDTEFKNRVLPFIKSKTLPLTLGVFLNYPEERATQSPRAEIEDLRAWYLHRSAAGVQYALSRRNIDDAWPLFKKAVGYRKSYSAHNSTDLDFAHAIVEFAALRGSAIIPESSVKAVTSALQAYRELDWMPELSPRAAVSERNRVERIAEAEAKVVLAQVGGAELTWSVFNDNRFEQHSNVWQGKPVTGTHASGERFLWRREAVPSLPLSSTPAPDTNVVALDKAAERFVMALRQQAQEFGRQGKNEQARDLEMVAQYFQSLVGGRPPSVPENAGIGGTLCRILAESQRGIPFANTGQFDRRFVTLCGLLAEKARDVCVELADGFAALAAEVGEDLEQKRLMEVAARLMTYPSPAEAVRRHSAELDVEVLVTVKRAANAARLGGNLAYSTRLNTMAAAIKSELEAIEKREILRAVAGRAPSPTAYAICASLEQ